jgi:hypothetical protein
MIFIFYKHLKLGIWKFSISPYCFDRQCMSQQITWNFRVIRENPNKLFQFSEHPFKYGKFSSTQDGFKRTVSTKKLQFFQSFTSFFNSKIFWFKTSIDKLQIEKMFSPKIGMRCKLWLSRWVFRGSLWNWTRHKNWVWGVLGDHFHIPKWVFLKKS